MYCVIFAVPDAPSFFSASNRGMTTVSSCRMMLAVMYGMIPSAKIASCSSAPPENSWIIWYRPAASPEVAWARHWFTLTMFTFGVGMTEPSRKTARMKSVNRIFLRRSGVRSAFAKAESMKRTYSLLCVSTA